MTELSLISLNALSDAATDVGDFSPLAAVAE